MSFDDELNQFIRNYAEAEADLTADNQHTNDPLAGHNHHHRVVTKQEVLDIDENGMKLK